MESSDDMPLIYYPPLHFDLNTGQYIPSSTNSTQPPLHVPHDAESYEGPMPPFSETAQTNDILWHDPAMNAFQPYCFSTEETLMGDFISDQGSSIDSPLKKRKRKAPTLRAKDWEPYKNRIRELHIDQGMSIPKVKEALEKEFGFSAEIRQYRFQLGKWDWDKSIKSKELKAIDKRRQERRTFEGEKGQVYVATRENSIESENTERWMNVSGVSEDALYTSGYYSSAVPSTMNYMTNVEHESLMEVDEHPSQNWYTTSTVQPSIYPAHSSLKRPFRK